MEKSLENRGIIKGGKGEGDFRDTGGMGFDHMPE